MLITSESWQLLCESVAHKQELLAYAAECGVKLSPALWGHAADNDLYLNYWGKTIGLGSLPARHNVSRQTTLISTELFKTMCLAHAETEQHLALLMST